MNVDDNLNYVSCILHISFYSIFNLAGLVNTHKHI